MGQYTFSSYMRLKQPIERDTTWYPEWVYNFTRLDTHNHSTNLGTQIPTGGIADSAVTTAKINDDAVTAAKLDDDADFVMASLSFATAASSYLKMIERATDPTNAANYGQIYIKEVSGVSELHFIDDAGNVTQITDAGFVNVGEIPLADSHIFVGNGSGIATDVAMSGDIAIDNTGNTEIQSGTVGNTEIDNTADIEVNTIAINDSDDSHQLKFVWNENDTGDRTLNYLVNGADRSVSLKGNLTSIGNITTQTTGGTANNLVVDLYNGDRTLELKANTISLDQSLTTFDSPLFLNVRASAALRLDDTDSSNWLSVVWNENEAVANRVLYLEVQGGDRTLVLNENLTVSNGQNVSLLAEDAACGITLDNANFEAENTNGTQRNIKITSDKAGDTTVTLKENLTINDGYDISFTSEDSAGALVLDNANFEVENTDGTQRNFKLVSAKAGNTTLTFEEDFTLSDGQNITMVAEDAAASLTFDNANVEFESTDASQRNYKFTSAKPGNITLTLEEDLTVSDGYAFSLLAEDAAGSITLDNATLEVERDGATQRALKLSIGTDAAAGMSIEGTGGVVDQDVTSDSSPTFASIKVSDTNSSHQLTIDWSEDDTSARAFNIAVGGGDRTLTLNENLTVSDGQNVSLLAEDAACGITLDNANFEVENTNGTQRLIKITSDKAGDTTLTLKENLSLNDGYDLGLTVEDSASALVFDNANFEVECGFATQRLLKLVVGTDAAATLTVEGTSGVINQDVTSDGDPSFNTIALTTDVDTPLVTNDSADLSLTTTTSGNINCNPVSKITRFCSSLATNANNIDLIFGDDTGGQSGFRSANGVMQYNNNGAGWVSFASALGANAALDNLAAVAINTTIESDSDNVDGCGTDAHEWADVYTYNIKHDSAGTPALNILTSGNNGDVVLTAHGTGEVKMESNPVSLAQGKFLVGEQELAATDFPGAGTLYAWHNNGAADFDGTDYSSGKTLTENTTGSGVDSMTDHLGNTVYCSFADGDTYLSSADAVFAITNTDFTCGGWFYKSTWAACAGWQYLMSRVSGNDGWLLALDNAGYLEFNTYSGGTTSQAIVGHTNLSAGWHYIVAAYENGVGSYIWIDGLPVARLVDTSNNITAAGVFTIGATAAPANYFIGGITECFYDIGDVYTDSEVKKLYAKSSNELMYINSNNEYRFVDGREYVGMEVPLYVTCANWTTNLGIGRIYLTPNGSYRFNFNVTGTWGVAATGNVALVLYSVYFPLASQAVAYGNDSSAEMYRGIAQTTTSQILLQTLAGHSMLVGYASGDVRIG